MSSPPSSVRLQFAQQLDDRDVTIGVACNGTPANTGEATPDPDGRSVEASLSGTQAGTCTVSYTVQSSTGGLITDSYEFTIEEQAETAETTESPRRDHGGDHAPDDTDPMPTARLRRPGDQHPGLR